jgi:hypothetical protein
MAKFKYINTGSDKARTRIRDTMLDAKCRGLAQSVKAQFSNSRASDSDASDSDPKHKKAGKAARKNKQAAKHANNNAAGRQPAAAQ